MAEGFYLQVSVNRKNGRLMCLEVTPAERTMLKYILLASAMTISVPVLAQDKPADTQAAPTTQTAPASTAPEATPAAPDATAPATGSPVDQAMQAVTPVTDQAAPQTAQTTPAPVYPSAAPAQTAQTTPAPADPAAAAPAQTAAAQPATSADQIAQVVSTEFPTYDKDASGTLNETEFSSWMVALKTASDPTTKAESAATKSWVNQAFASADTDKNKSLSKTELTGFLTKGS
jgi:hypothetical protein